MQIITKNLKKWLLFGCLALNYVHAADVTLELGYVYGKHLTSEDVNDSHTFARFGDNKILNAYYFHNSNQVSCFGLAHRFSASKYFHLEVGIVNGYTKHQVPDTIWFNRDLMLIVAPVIDLPLDKHWKLKGIILGDSINGGISYTF